MLVNVHGPKVNQIHTHSDANGSDEFTFHTVQLAESAYGDKAGRVDLFIRADWSDWDAIVEQVTEYRQTAAVRALGAEHGRNAGTWAIDGNTDAATAQRIIDGYEAGDPEMLDMAPSPLSGEWADGPLPNDVYRAAGIDVDALDGNGEPLFDDPSWLLDEYESAYSETYWAEVLRAAHAMVDDDGFTCSVDPCNGAIRDRGEDGGTAERLGSLRAAIRAENISYGEVAELQLLGAAGKIPDDDVELREWAGLPEHGDSDV